LFAGPIHKSLKIIPVLFPVVNMAALAGRVTVPAMIITVHGIARCSQWVNQVHVPSTVLANPMDDHEDGARVPIRLPALVVEFDLPCPLAKSLLVFHPASFLLEI
jgi:hypothetical protein